MLRLRYFTQTKTKFHLSYGGKLGERLTGIICSTVFKLRNHFHKLCLERRNATDQFITYGNLFARLISMIQPYHNFNLLNKLGGNKKFKI